MIINSKTYPHIEEFEIQFNSNSHLFQENALKNNEQTSLEYSYYWPAQNSKATCLLINSMLQIKNHLLFKCLLFHVLIIAEETWVTFRNSKVISELYCSNL